MIKTNKERYNVPYVTQAECFIQKYKATVRQRYGVDSVLQLKEVRKKSAQTMYAGTSVRASKAQRHIFNLLKENNENVELNYHFDKFYLDIAFLDNLIFCEHDGQGHNLNVILGEISEEEFIKKEETRTSILINAGWKEMRIISTKKKKLPNDSVLLKMIYLAKEYLLNTNHLWIHINLDEQCFIFTKDKIKVSFDSLKTIL